MEGERTFFSRKDAPKVTFITSSAKGAGKLSVTVGLISNWYNLFKINLDWQTGAVHTSRDEERNSAIMSVKLLLPADLPRVVSQSQWPYRIRGQDYVTWFNILVVFQFSQEKDLHWKGDRSSARKVHFIFFVIFFFYAESSSRHQRLEALGRSINHYKLLLTRACRPPLWQNINWMSVCIFFSLAYFTAFEFQDDSVLFSQSSSL